ncbi:hypothetical protein BD324DRAFT_639939 [Kockovaella imperatae]|uniref:Uncharacterized protein n=1 Tax=Kockovaella imperatae TaxID=4999 RepID=A0A1Y1U5X4_9TREE|nr:hypothetical protein BD324DRAFT_639939 [Kockovaella imperatae]ORX33392.1 hypothetical protein BD324DRAFT_639939 [Kockovaella imperatae]
MPSTSRHPLLGAGAQGNPTTQADDPHRRRRHPTFFLSSSRTSPALDTSSFSHSHHPGSSSSNDKMHNDTPSSDPSDPISMDMSDEAVQPIRSNGTSAVSLSYPRTHGHSHTAHTSPARSRRPSASHSTGLRRPSRASLIALRTALQEYQVRSPHTPEKRVQKQSAYQDMGDPMQSQSMSTLDLKNVANALGPETMDALVEIHRVLYKGCRGKDEDAWTVREKEVRRVVERWLEADCSYDHPLVQTTSRQSFLAHFVLLHLVSSLSVPSLTPSNLIAQARSTAWYLRSAILGAEELSSPDVEAVYPAENKIVKNRARQASLTSDHQVGWPDHTRLDSSVKADEQPSSAKWWKLWEVSAACRDIGAMECYDGYHLALIDHTITLTLFPSLSTRTHSDSLLSRSPSLDSLVSSDDDLMDLASPDSNPTFLRRLVGALADEFEYLLHWDLPVSTIVEFNEVGKATHIRDVVDVRDVVETFVPFAKRFGWLTRRMTGLMSATVGVVAMSLLGSISGQAGVGTRTDDKKVKTMSQTGPFILILSSM